MVGAKGKGGFGLYVSSRGTSIILVVFAGAGCAVDALSSTCGRSLPSSRSRGDECVARKARGVRGSLCEKAGLKGKKGRHD